MIAAPSLDALRSALGEDAVEGHEPILVDGVELAATLRPADGAGLSAALELLGRCGHGALLRGGGSRLALGNPPTRAEVVISTERLVGVDVFEPDEGVCHARAGTRLSVLRDTTEEHGWELPLDPPGAETTVGGTLASAAIGPRAQGYGLPRDAVLGLEVVLASGERTRCGGRVVKNVTGYDLNKLYTGSLGTLGVIEGAWLRLRSTPAAVRVLAGAVDPSGEGFGRCVEAARRPTVRMASLTHGSGATGFRLVVELAGVGAAVEIDAAWLHSELGLAEAAPEAVDRVRALQGELGGSEGVRVRIAALPSSLGPALAALAETGAAIVAHPGLGLLYAAHERGWELHEPGHDADFIEVAVARAREAAGSWRVEAAPLAVKAGRDVFGDPRPDLALARALKRQFDPAGLLNAGRFAGHL